MTKKKQVTEKEFLFPPLVFHQYNLQFAYVKLGNLHLQSTAI